MVCGKLIYESLNPYLTIQERRHRIIRNIVNVTLTASSLFHPSYQWSGTLLNIKTVVPDMGIRMLKIRRSWDRLIFNMGIPLSVRRHIYIETASWWSNFHGECHFRREDNLDPEKVILENIVLGYLQYGLFDLNTQIYLFQIPKHNGLYKKVIWF